MFKSGISGIKTPLHDPHTFPLLFYSNSLKVVAQGHGGWVKGHYLERVDAAKGVTKRKITRISYENKRYCTLTLSEAEMKKEVVHILTITHFRL